LELRVEVRPAWPFRLQRHGGADGVLRHRGGVLERLLHHNEQPVVVRVAQTAPDRVLFGARAPSPEAAEHGIARMRFALGLDDDLRPFHDRFRSDPLIGASVRRRPWLRIRRRPQPFEALAWAICEQLIEFERAAAIQRRIVAALGPRRPGWEGSEGRPGREGDGGRPGWEGGGDRTGWERGADEGADGPGHGPRDVPAPVVLCDVPAPAVLAGVAPALLQSLDLAGGRALTLVRAAREVARGRIDLHAPEHERGWRRLRAIPGIGPWTVEMLALAGQGRYDQIPAGDLGLLKLVGRHLGGGDPRAYAQEAQVREFFAPYDEWAGLAAAHMMGAY
jgi:3-methyladenine DNA glycosylase/8-oxoguanine DNA glycosylase